MVNLQQPSHREGSRLLLVDSSVLPEVFLRVVEAKRMLAVGQVRSLSEAAKAAGISRSALYKYKDCVFVHNEALDDKELIDMGAQIILCDPHRATVIGHDHRLCLRATRMTSPDIRAGVALLIAAMSAEGVSTIQNIDQIDRGYKDIDGRLNALGAKITRIDDCK